MKPIKSNLLFILSFLLSLHLFAGVNLKNGNYYISFSDLHTSNIEFVFGGFTRTYNSKSTEIGLFGYGWGTQWETKMYFFPDGHISVKEHGAGGTTIFFSDLVSQESIQLMIDTIIKTKLENNLLENNPSAILKLQNKLADNISQRHAEWMSLKKKNLLNYTPELIEGLVFEAYSRGSQQITITNNGFERLTISEQTKEYFNTDGRLIKYTDKNGRFTEIEYVNDKITKMICSDGAVIHFKTNDKGYITEAKLNNATAVFKYQEDNLVYNKDAVGNHYQFVYDKIHNLTKVVYNPIRVKGYPEDAIHITYEDKTSYCSSITDRNGETVNYEYKKYFNEDGTEDGDHYATIVSKKGWNGEIVKNTYEYFIGVGATGGRYTQKIITSINGIITSTTYEEQCGLPLEIIRGKNETHFTYNNRCKLTRKTSTSGTDIEMKYHPTLEKLVHVRNEQGEFNFEYNTKGDLIKVEKANGDFVKLVYTENGKITKMITNSETLLFEYNKIGKPIMIEIENVGKINVTYDKYGEISRVSSEDGHETSLKVTQAFQKLLAMVKPAGVNLGM